MVLGKSRFAVTVDETAKLGQWFFESLDLLLQLMKRPSWVCGSWKV